MAEPREPTGKARKTGGRTASDAKSAQNTTNDESGVNSTAMSEPMPEYLAAPCEKVIAGANNTYIILGRDRPFDRASGKAGRGESHCGMVRIIAGLQGYDAKAVNQEGKKLFADPDLEKDAASIYISQKAVIDDYLSLATEPNQTIDPDNPKSAIALKADEIRVVSRQDIKMVTVTDKKNAQGGDIQSTYGIHLVGGNKAEDLEPMVRGDQLVKYLKKLQEEISKLNGIFAGYIDYQRNINEAFFLHYHDVLPNLLLTMPPFKAWPQTLDGMTKHFSRSLRSLVTQKANLSTLEENYLSSTNYGKSENKNSPAYILSGYHKLN